MTGKPLRIAVIGAGISGIGAAYILQQEHDVTLYESRPRLGGHTHTVKIPDGPDAGTAIDTGFIVCNDKTYPTFHRFLKRLGVSWRWSDMSFGFYDETSGLQYAGTDLRGLFAQKANIANPAFLKMLLEIMRFSRVALRDLANDRIEQMTLDRYLKRHKFDSYFTQNYLLPMGAAIWSTRSSRMMSFPAATFIRFLANHGLLSFKDRPRWQTVVGGSSSYVESFRQRFTGSIRLEAKVSKVCRLDKGAGVVLCFEDGHWESYDHVVLGVHADRVLQMLENPTLEESSLFEKWRYETNHVVLHTDTSVLPPNRRAWASWNYTREAGTPEDSRLSMTYYMNLLQGLRTRQDYCVTLNRGNSIAEDKVLRRMVYRHPLYTKASRATQAPLRALSGSDRISYCGAWFDYGFHEDGISSAVKVGKEFGLRL